MKLIDDCVNTDRSLVAEIFESEKGYSINFYQDAKKVGMITYFDKSIHFVRDAAENFVCGIFRIDDVRRYIA